VRLLQQEKEQNEDKEKTLEKENLILISKITEIQKRMNDHLKDMVTESDLENLRMIPWIEMNKDLSKPIIVGQEGSIDLQRQIEICEYMIVMFKHKKRKDEYRIRCVNVGIYQTFINIFETWKLEDIRLQHIRAFQYLSFSENDEIVQLFISQHPFYGLHRILDHSDNQIQQRSINTIRNFIIFGANNTPVDEQHQFFTELDSIGIIKQIYEIMNQKDSDKDSKDSIAICLGQIYKTRCIENVLLKVDVISYLKQMINDEKLWKRNESRKALKFLEQNEVNKTEIEKDGFIIPT
ncbi:MAG: hypothetical protein EZS28_041536, partial [Streblomastix strix]